MAKSVVSTVSAGDKWFDVGFEIELQDAVERLKGLEPKVRKKIIRQAIRPAMKIVQRDAIARAPRGESGLLKKSIKVRAFKRSRTKIGVSVSTAKGWFKGDAFYGGFQEWGWKQGKRSLGSMRRHIPGFGYMQGAYESKGDEARDVAMTGILLAVDEVWKGK